MPVYDGMPYLPLALDSILRQTFRDFEFIVIDDGSTDATADILAVCAARDPRLRVLTLPQSRGIVAALNSGLGAARGEFIARMDADDIALPERLEQQVGFLDAHPDHVLVGSSSSFIDSVGKVTFRDTYWREAALLGTGLDRAFLHRNSASDGDVPGAPVRDIGCDTKSVSGMARTWIFCAAADGGKRRDPARAAAGGAPGSVAA